MQQRAARTSSGSNAKGHDRGPGIGFFRREIADAAFRYQCEVDAKRKLIVGVNAFQEAEEKPLETLVIDESVEKEQIDSLRTIKAARDADAVRKTLAEIRRVAATKETCCRSCSKRRRLGVRWARS